MRSLLYLGVLLAAIVVGFLAADAHCTWRTESSLTAK
jgi:hypothetical protein